MSRAYKKTDTLITQENLSKILQSLIGYGKIYIGWQYTKPIEMRKGDVLVVRTSNGDYKIFKVKVSSLFYSKGYPLSAEEFKLLTL